jgi:hypothetical protein
MESAADPYVDDLSIWKALARVLYEIPIGREVSMGSSGWVISEGKFLEFCREFYTSEDSNPSSEILLKSTRSRPDG